MILPFESWQQDPEFKALEPSMQMKAYMNYFDQNLADDEFRGLPPERQKSIRDNFAKQNSIGGTEEEAQPDMTLDEGKSRDIELKAIGPKTIKKLRTNIVNSSAWKQAAISDRQLIIQDLESLVDNPENIQQGVTENDLLKRYSGKPFDMALSGRLKGESDSVFGDIMKAQGDGDMRPTRSVPMNPKGDAMPIPGLAHMMPSGETMPGPEHMGAVPGSTRMMPEGQPAMPKGRRKKS